MTNSHRIVEMPDPIWDMIIVGGGLSGLSLAVEMAQPEFSHLRVLILEKRGHYERDRTWSYWPRGKHRYIGLERRQWSRWCVKVDSRHAEQQSASGYSSIDADTFYSFARSQIDAAPHVHLELDVVVTDLVEGSIPVVVLADGRRLAAKWVMDARPLPKPNAKALCQHFVGWEIEATQDCFDENVVELMDFQRNPDGLHFFYTLPYSRRQALIETTWISPNGHQPDYAAEIQTYLAKRYGVTAWRCLYVEQGRLDLESEPRRVTCARVVPLGRAAGTLRPATGFAFLETIADAERIARCIRRSGIDGAVIAAYRRSQVDRWMDRLFLQAMKQNWHVAPNFFLAMFSGVCGQTLVDFLAGKSAISQRLKVSWQLPKLPFLRAAMRMLTS